ncbi:MAG: AAA family ATPase [Terriglobales bacterium]|jgi:KaiC/GvpD/RAD55 family RecA-like ATPase
MTTAPSELAATSSAGPQTAFPDSLPLTHWEPKPIDWLWEPYLARGMLTMLSGAAGAGKTCIALDIAAAVTAGRRTPPGNVLYLTASDNPEYVLRPRFEACGGDAGRLHVVRDQLSGKDVLRKEPQLAAIDSLQKLIEQSGAALVVVDPLHSYLDPVYARRPKIRAVLDRVSRLAEDMRCAFLLVRSQNRTATGRPVEFEAVRSMLLAGDTTDDPARRAMIHLRSNCGVPGPTLAYAIDAGGALRWTGHSELSAWAILEPEPHPDVKSALENAMEFLCGELRFGPKEARFIKREARRVLITEITLRRARERLGVKAFQKGSDWLWQLPPAAEPANNVHDQGDQDDHLTENKGVSAPEP